MLRGLTLGLNFPSPTLVGNSASPTPHLASPSIPNGFLELGLMSWTAQLDESNQNIGVATANNSVQFRERNWSLLSVLLVSLLVYSRSRARSVLLHILCNGISWRCWPLTPIMTTDSSFTIPTMSPEQVLVFKDRSPCLRRQLPVPTGFGT